MKIDLHATTSSDGFIADINGSEDCFPDSNWKSACKLYKNYDAILWGRKTDEAIKSWGEKYLKAVKVKIIVLSRSEYKDDKVIAIKNLKELKKLNFNNILVCCGRQVYELAMNELPIKNCFFNFNFFDLGEGISFPAPNNKMFKLITFTDAKKKEFVQVQVKVSKLKGEK